MFEQANRYVSAAEAQPFEQESTCNPDANLVRAPVLQSESGELLDIGQSFSRALVKILLRSDLLKDPRLDQSATGDHDRVNLGVLESVVVVDV